MNPFKYFERKKSDSEEGGQGDELRLQEDVVRPYFDAAFYVSRYPDIKQAGIDPLRHYMQHGWREGRDPSSDFDTSGYLLAYKDVNASGRNPLFHYVKWGKEEGRCSRSEDIAKAYFHRYVPHIMQNISFPVEIERAKKLFVIIVPEHNTMSGGIYSFFSIAKAVYDMRHKHGYAVVLMTRPNAESLTYLRQRNFRNSEDVYRFEQITRCRLAREIYLQIPEYAAPTFLDSIGDDVSRFLAERNVYVNILNQNIELMPESEAFDKLRSVALEVTQSVAHHSYYSQEHANKYNLPTLLLPAYTDLSGYLPIDRREKEKLIIYSPDQEAHREPVLKALKEQLPDYKLVEIKNITFDKFMELASRCMFSITFGEGFDGYIAQPIYQGGIGFAMYREEFFPTDQVKGFANIFEDEEDMIDNIVNRIRAFEASDELYRKVNRDMMAIYDSLYSKEDYLRRIEKLVNREFELFPAAEIGMNPVVRL